VSIDSPVVAKLPLLRYPVVSKVDRNRDMEIPREKLTIRFARSGGPGGQNVNRVETKVEVRFVLAEADWIPPKLKELVFLREGHRLTDRGELILTSTRSRSQSQNLEDCLRKLESLLEAASRTPRARVRTRPTRASGARRLAAKRVRKQRKGFRGKPSADD
jgi:ribosome-associated protein